jgi:hypothetical protein
VLLYGTIPLLPNQGCADRRPCLEIQLVMQGRPLPLAAFLLHLATGSFYRFGTFHSLVQEKAKRQGFKGPGPVRSPAGGFDRPRYDDRRDGGRGPGGPGPFRQGGSRYDDRGPQRGPQVRCQPWQGMQGLLVLLELERCVVSTCVRAWGLRLPEHRGMLEVLLKIYHFGRDWRV